MCPSADHEPPRRSFAVSLSGVQRPVVGFEQRLAQRLAEGGMGMDETRGVGKRGVVADELFRFRDDVGCDGRDHVHAEHDPDAGLLRADAADEDLYDRLAREYPD